jgi:probable phosphoglycerate mutase
VTEALDIPCQSEPGLREVYNGVATGLSVVDSKLLELPQTEPIWDWIAYPQAESWRMLETRVFDTMDRIAGECAGTAMVVTHGMSGAAVVHWWLRLGECCRRTVYFSLDPASITVLQTNGYLEQVIERLNDTGHLAGLTS